MERKRKCQGRPLFRKIRLFPGSLLIISNSCWGFTEGTPFASGQKTLGINLFCSVCMAQKYPPSCFQRDCGGLSWWLFAQCCKIPRERRCINITFAQFPCSQHNSNIYGRLQGAAWCRSQVTIMTEKIHLNWLKMCVAGKLCPGANNRIDSQEMMTLSKWIDRCSHTNTL